MLPEGAAAGKLQRALKSNSTARSGPFWGVSTTSMGTELLKLRACTVTVRLVVEPLGNWIVTGNWIDGARGGKPSDQYSCTRQGK